MEDLEGTPSEAIGRFVVERAASANTDAENGLDDSDSSGCDLAISRLHL